MQSWKRYHKSQNVHRGRKEGGSAFFSTQLVVSCTSMYYYILPTVELFYYFKDDENGGNSFSSVWKESRFPQPFNLLFEGSSSDNGDYGGNYPHLHFSLSWFFNNYTELPYFFLVKHFCDLSVDSFNVWHWWSADPSKERSNGRWNCRWNCHRSSSHTTSTPTWELSKWSTQSTSWWHWDGIRSCFSQLRRHQAHRCAHPGCV